MHHPTCPCCKGEAQGVLGEDDAGLTEALELHVRAALDSMPDRIVHNAAHEEEKEDDSAADR